MKMFGKKAGFSEKPKPKALPEQSLFEGVKSLFDSAEKYENTGSFYYQTHACPAAGKDIKVMLDFKLKSDLTGELVTLGICPECHTVYYHEELESRIFD